MNMREKIAESIWQAEWTRAGIGGKRRVPWSEIAEVDQEKYRFLADAVLDALMEPTTSMMDEGVEPFRTGNVRDSSINGKCGRIFVRMIQAAKEGK